MVGGEEEEEENYMGGTDKVSLPSTSQQQKPEGRGLHSRPFSTSMEKEGEGGTGNHHAQPGLSVIILHKSFDMG